jgi:hypothetical protein
MVKKITDLNILLINTPEEAKKYADYNGKTLADNEKAIFDNDLFKDGKNPDGTDKYKVDDIKNAVALLANLKEAQASLPTEKADNDNNLSANGNDLLITFLEQRRNNTIAYRAVNVEKAGISPTDKTPVDAIVKEYQSLQHQRVNRKLEAAKREVDLALISIEKEGEKQDREIEKAQKAIDKNMSIAEANAYKTRVEAIVNALKADLAVGQPGYKILHEMVNIQRRIADVMFKYSSTLPNSLGSIIRTGVADPYSNDPFTKSSYLADDLP